MYFYFLVKSSNIEFCFAKTTQYKEIQELLMSLITDLINRSKAQLIRKRFDMETILCLKNQKFKTLLNYAVKAQQLKLCQKKSSAIICAR